MEHRVCSKGDVGKGPGVERGWSRGEVCAQLQLLPFLGVHPSPRLVRLKQEAVETGNMSQRDMTVNGTTLEQR